MTYKWLQSFIAVAQEGGITKAAKRLYISPQALWQQINLLENTVNFKLFSRSSTGAKLTPAGEEFYKGALKLLDLYGETLNRCRDICNTQETIRIPVMSDIVIPQFMENICAEYRATEARCFAINFIHTTAPTSSWIDGLINREYDIIEFYTIDGYTPEGIYFEKYFDVQTWCLMHGDHPLAGKDVIHPKDLNGFRIAAPSVRLMRHFQIFIENTGVKVEFEEIAGNRYKIMQSCDRGYICFLNESIAKMFPGFVCAPLQFDTQVQSGLACRDDMVETYSAFFAAARKIIIAAV